MEDKTTKIPSLKEFQKSQQTHSKKGDTKKVRIPQQSVDRAVKTTDIHREKVGRPSRLKPKFDEDVKIREPKRSDKSSSSKVSGSTRKIDSRKINEADDRFKAFEEKPKTERKREDLQRPLTRTRVAGQRPVNHTVTREIPASRERNPQSGYRTEPSRSGRPPQQGRGCEPPRRPDGMKHAPQPKDNRVHHKKKKKPLSPRARKLLRVIVYSLVVTSFLAVGVIICMLVLFKTENIVVNVPDKFYSSQEIIEASGLDYHDSIILANKSGAEQRLEGKFPYIKSADVYAVMPDTINIDITLSTPSYAVKTDKLTYIASEDSKVLDVVSTADEVRVPLIEGVTVNNAKAGEHLEFESDLVKDSLNEMFNLAKEKGYKNITRVDIETRTNTTGVTTMEIRYVYDDRIVVYMGIPENITYKMQTAQTIISEKLDVNGAVLTGELDVSNSFDTKKSYFNQYSLIPEVIVTEPASTPATTAPATEAPSPEDDGYYDDGYSEGGDYYDSEESYEGAEYAGEDGYYQDEEVYADEENYADSEY